MSKRKGYRRRKSSDNMFFLLLIGAALLLSTPWFNASNPLPSSTILITLVIILLGGSSILFYVLYKTSQHRQALRALGLIDVDTMKGKDFERWVGEQLRVRGYSIRYTPINDYGVDIVARKGGTKTAVQVKRYSNPLDQKPVREAVAGMLHYACSASMVVTNSSFTRAAKELAKSNHCELIDRDKLADWLSRIHA